MFICQPDIVAIDRKWDHGPHPMPTPAHLRFEALYGALKAAAEATRLRILALLGEAELTVSDLTAILRQSQPRISAICGSWSRPGWSSASAKGRGPSSAWASGRMPPSLPANSLPALTPATRRSRATASG